MHVLDLRMMRRERRQDGVAVRAVIGFS